MNTVRRAMHSGVHPWMVMDGHGSCDVHGYCDEGYAQQCPSHTCQLSWNIRDSPGFTALVPCPTHKMLRYVCLRKPFHCCSAFLLQTQLERHKRSPGRSVSEAALCFRNLCVYKPSPLRKKPLILGRSLPICSASCAANVPRKSVPNASVIFFWTRTIFALNVTNYPDLLRYYRSQLCSATANICSNLHILS